eukprot:1148694-Rhodomonas_salina.4
MPLPGVLDIGYGLGGSSVIETVIDHGTPDTGNVTGNVTRNVTVLREVVTFVPGGNVTDVTCLLAQSYLQLSPAPTPSLYSHPVNVSLSSPLSLCGATVSYAISNRSNGAAPSTPYTFGSVIPIQPAPVTPGLDNVVIEAVLTLQGQDATSVVAPYEFPGPTSLRPRYALSGTDLAFRATRGRSDGHVSGGHSAV